MDPNNVLYALSAFIALLFVTAGFINGVFITTRGETVEDIDGVQRDEDAMIFYPIQKLICKRREDLYVQFKRDHLQRLVSRILKAHPALPRNFRFTSDEIEFTGGGPTDVWTAEEEMPRAIQGSQLWHDYTRDWMYEHHIVPKVFVTETLVRMEFYEKRKQYVLPEIIRKPTVQCIKCMPSFWGSLVWWGTVLSVYDFEPGWQIAAWIVFCFTLSFLCTFFYKLAKV